VGLTKEERDALRSVRWEAALDEGLNRRGKSAQDLVSRPMKQEWKLALAEEIREGTGAAGSPTIFILAGPIPSEATCMPENIAETNRTRPDPIGPGFGQA